MTTTKLTKVEMLQILRAVKTIAARAKFAGDDHDSLSRIFSLVDMLSGTRYDLCDESGDTIRKATVCETIDSLMAGGEGFIVVDGQPCYVDV